MMTVWKAVLNWPADEQVVIFPQGAELLTVQLQGDHLCIWARVDPGGPVGDYTIRTCGTGHPINDCVGKYLGTFQLHGGALVFHAFGKEGA